MKTTNYENTLALGFVSTRERTRCELELERARLAKELHRHDLSNDTEGTDALRSGLDAVKTRLASLDAVEPSDFVCSTRGCGNAVDMDDPEARYTVLDVPQFAEFHGRVLEEHTWIGHHPALALALCAECSDHLTETIKARLIQNE